MFLRKGRSGLIGGLVVGLIFSLIDWLIFGSRGRPSVSQQSDLLGLVIVGLIGGLIGGVTTGIIGGLTDDIRADKIVPNLGIKLSRGTVL